VQEFIPEIVSGEKDGMNNSTDERWQTLSYMSIIPLCVHEIKKLRLANRDYCNNIIDLSSNMQQMQDKIDELQQIITKQQTTIDTILQRLSDARI
jgi:TolA-binding protein